MQISRDQLSVIGDQFMAYATPLRATVNALLRTQYLRYAIAALINYFVTAIF